MKFFEGETAHWQQIIRFRCRSAARYRTSKVPFKFDPPRQLSRKRHHGLLMLPEMPERDVIWAQEVERQHVLSAAVAVSAK